MQKVPGTVMDSTTAGLEKKIVLLICTLLCWGVFGCSSPTDRAEEGKDKEESNLSFKVLAENLSIPWEILWGEDQALWMTNHFPNQILRLDPETLAQDTFWVQDSALDALGQHYIMGMAQHPGFPEEPFIFISHNYILEQDPSAMRMTCKKYRLDGATHSLVDPQTIVEEVYTSNSNLPGGRLLIVYDSILMVATSDEKALNDQARDPKSWSGKILGFDLDGNPLRSVGDLPDAVLAMGVRNAQGLTETSKGNVFFCDHGPSGDDEVNQLIPGSDYGWPDVHGYCDKEEEKGICSNASIAEPVKAWTPTIAPSSLTFYDHSRYPALRNSLLLTTLKESDVRILKLNEDQTEIVSEQILYNNQFGRIRDLAVSDDGRIFLTTANQIPETFEYSLPQIDQDLSYDVVVELIPESETPNPKPD